MSHLPDQNQQIITTHAAFICQVVETGQNPARRQELNALLFSAEENGWKKLVGAIRLLLAGQREPQVFLGLDEEDQVIAEAILRGLQDPATLPDPNARPDPGMAAPGLAAMIQAAATGDIRALQLMSEMATQMSRAGGPMARLAAVIRPLINGEREPDKLCKGMDTKTANLVLGILAELGKSGVH